jgi:energy-coupling factor transporter transmembrane protein EcfT
MTAMSRFRIPYKFNFILGSALRFAPLFYTNFATITDAQKLRGHDMDKMKLLEKVMKGYVPIVTPLVLLLLRSSDDMQIAIESRAFGAPVKRTFVEELRMSRLDYLVVGFSLGLVLVTIYGVVTQGSLVPVGLIPYWAKPA